MSGHVSGANILFSLHESSIDLYLTTTCSLVCSDRDRYRHTGTGTFGPARCRFSSDWHSAELHLSLTNNGNKRVPLLDRVRAASETANMRTCQAAIACQCNGNRIRSENM